MQISTADVKTLRERTGAGIMDCKKALIETEGDFDKAADMIKAKGLESILRSCLASSVVSSPCSSHFLLRSIPHSSQKKQRRLQRWVG